MRDDSKFIHLMIHILIIIIHFVCALILTKRSKPHEIIGNLKFCLLIFPSKKVKAKQIQICILKEKTENLKCKVSFRMSECRVIDCIDQI